MSVSRAGAHVLLVAGSLLLAGIAGCGDAGRIVGVGRSLPVTGMWLARVADSVQVTLTYEIRPPCEEYDGIGTTRSGDALFLSVLGSETVGCNAPTMTRTESITAAADPSRWLYVVANSVPAGRPPLIKQLPPAPAAAGTLP